MQGKFVEKVKQVCKEWFGENPEESPDLCRIVSDRHFNRLESLISSSKGHIALGKYYTLILKDAGGSKQGILKTFFIVF